MKLLGIVRYKELILKHADEDKRYAVWKHSIKANVIVGHVFWPEGEGVLVDWAQACIGNVGECVSIPTRQGQWNTFIFPLTQHEHEDNEGNRQPLNEMEHSAIWLQGEINGIDEQESYTFYVDEIQILSEQP